MFSDMSDDAAVQVARKLPCKTLQRYCAADSRMQRLCKTNEFLVRVLRSCDRKLGERRDARRDRRLAQDVASDLTPGLPFRGKSTRYGPQMKPIATRHASDALTKLEFRDLWSGKLRDFVQNYVAAGTLYDGQVLYVGAEYRPDENGFVIVDSSDPDGVAPFSISDLLYDMQKEVSSLMREFPDVYSSRERVIALFDRIYEISERRFGANGLQQFAAARLPDDPTAIWT